MSSIIKVDTIQDQDGNNIINENADTITIGASGDTITVPSGATFDASNATTTLPATVVTTDGSQTLTNKTIDASQLTGTITPSDNTVTNAKIVDSTIQLAKLSATGTKDATTFLRGDNTFDTPPLGGITGADQWRLNTDVQFGTGDQVIDTNWERVDAPSGYGTIGSAMSQSSGIFTFPTTGIWLIQHQHVVIRTNGEIQRHFCKINTTINNSTYNQASISVVSTAAANYFITGYVSYIFDVTSTANCKVRFSYSDPDSNNPTLVGSTNETYLGSTFIRLGDT